MKSTVALALAAQAAAQLVPGTVTANHSCITLPNPLVKSCSSDATPSKVDSCCAETYGGLLLATQFWSTYTGLESKGQLLPANTWTLHGLWPDFCDGSYTQYCDLQRQYDPTPSPNTTTGKPGGTPVLPYTGRSIATFITDFARYDLLDWMNKYWINQGAPNDDFWGHEFSKHATCYSTFQTECYGPSYVQHEEVIDFFETAIMYYRRLPTFTWLSNAGIKPSNTTTYSYSQFQQALSRSYGATPYIGCSGPRYNETAAGRNSTDNGRTAISEVWYFAHAYGRPQDGVVAVTNSTTNSSCARTPGALHYYEQTASSVRKL